MNRCGIKPSFSAYAVGGEERAVIVVGLSLMGNLSVDMLSGMSRVNVQSIYPSFSTSGLYIHLRSF